MVRPPRLLRDLSLLLSTLAFTQACAHRDIRRPLVIETDFGTVDGAVSAMKGVALAIDPSLTIHDLTHEVAPFDIWEGAFRLAATAPFWPADTVFVCVVDPGVGTSRGAIVLEAKNGQLFVGPDNGLFTLIARDAGVASVHRIDEAKHRRPGSEASHTFHGRDLFTVVAARLASGSIEVGDVGPRLDGEPQMLPIPTAHATTEASGAPVLQGVVTVLDSRFGNVWTNIRSDDVRGFRIAVGDPIHVTIVSQEGVHFDETIRYVNTFGAVPEGQPLAYLDSQGTLALALNLGDLAAAYGIRAGPTWRVEVRRP